MSEITIYTTAICPYCHAAKRLLNEKGAEFNEIDVTFNPSKRAEMRSRSDGKNSVPQIFIGDRHIGGCDDLYGLEQNNELDDLLKPESVQT